MKAQCAWVSSAERGEDGGWGWEGSLLFLICFSFFTLEGTASDLICFQLPAEDDVSPLPVRYVLHMQKLQNILESHRCPFTAVPAPTPIIRWEQSDSSSL